MHYRMVFPYVRCGSRAPMLALSVRERAQFQEVLLAAIPGMQRTEGNQG